MATGSVVPGIFTQVDAAAVIPVGTIMHDDANGNEYVYVNGVASVAANDFCRYTAAYALVRSVASGVGLYGIAQGAINTAAKAGWLLVRGTGTVAAGATATNNTAIFLHATAGSISSTGVGGDGIFGMLPTATQTGAGSVAVQLTYPFTRASTT